MQTEEFRRVLHLGLGRITLYLQEHDATPYQECILNACLNNTTYDPQSEGGKTPYLYEIIQLTHKESFYREAILQAMATIPSPVPETIDLLDWDASQFFDFGVIFARQGDEEARQATYRLFTKRASRFCEFGADDLIDLDGLAGFIFVARHLYSIATSPDETLNTWYLEIAAERFGHERVLQYIEQATATEPQLKSFINYSQERAIAPRKRNKRAVEDYSFVKHLIDVWKTKYNEDEQFKGSTQNRLAVWGRRATDDAILLAARDMLNATPDDIRPYLAIFRKRAFPFDYRALLPWTRNSDPDIVASALAALVHFHAPEVHTIALHLTEKQEMISNALDLLIHNYQAGDHVLIEQILANTNDPDELHSIGSSVLDIFEQNATQDCLQALQQLYEYGPCSYCRENAVRLLIQQQVFPAWMARECMYDSRPDIREMTKLWLDRHPN